MTTTENTRQLAADGARFLGDPAFRVNPEDFYRRLVEEAPVLPLGNGTWLIGGHAELRAALRDTRFSRAAGAAHESEFLSSDPRPEVQRMGRCLRGTMLYLDPPEHARVRKFHRDPFLPRAVREWQDEADRIADELARNLPKDEVFDLKEKFALPIPERLICTILGVPVEDHKLWEEWTGALLRLDRTGHAEDGGFEEARAAMVAFGEYFDALIRERRENPGDDLISVLVAEDETGDRLTDDELVGNLILLTSAGHETTANTIASTVVLLLRDRANWDRLLADPSLADKAIEEVLRIEGAQRFMVPRTTTEDVEIGGHTIPAGDRVIFVTHAANRDPSAFPDPLRFDIDRDPKSHVAFGGGAHTCLGVHLARLELVTALRALLRHHPNLALAVPEEQLETSPTPTVRGWESLPCISTTA
ncbi:cytochrome P450 [Pseudonocardia thermophila]|nr:cytochrome P450 [Pseudonocardia thermophila]